MAGRRTKNRAEIQAAIQAIELANQCGISKLCICTECEFLIKASITGMHQWNGCAASGRAETQNEDDLRELERAIYDQHNLVIKWIRVPSNSGIVDNSRVHQLAKAGVRKYNLRAKNVFGMDF